MQFQLSLIMKCKIMEINKIKHKKLEINKIKFKIMAINEIKLLINLHLLN